MAQKGDEGRKGAVGKLLASRLLTHQVTIMVVQSDVQTRHRAGEEVTAEGSGTDAAEQCCCTEHASLPESSPLCS